MGNPPGPVNDTLTISTDFMGKFAVTDSIILGLRVPLALSFFDDAVDGDDSGAALGNIGLSVTGIRATGRGVRFGLGAVLYINTRSDGVDSGAVASSAALLAIPDQGRWANATTARGRADFRVRSNAVFFQAEGNLDLLFREGDDDVDLTLALGPGIDLSPNLSLLLELTIANITDNSLVVVDIGMRYQVGRSLFGLRAYLPTEELGGEDVVGIGFDAGARF